MSLIQKLFDKAVTHLLTQNEKSTNILGSCRYRGPNGLKCAIGALIDDKWYDAETLESNSVIHADVLYAVAKSQGSDAPLLTESHLKILSSLQDVHDSCHPYEWKDKLTALAEQYNLTMPTGI